MTNSRQIAGLIGPTLIAVTISESINVRIWSTNIAPVIHLNGALLFLAGLSIVRAHNQWIYGWPVVVTLVGWFAMLVGLFRMFFPGLYLQGVQNTSAVMVVVPTMMVLAVGIVLTFKAYVREGG
ncbi:MAG TPA: hypothetical protein VGU74_15910 [Gemmatimonadales bacterium]|nr:hypothetical protein [Gemmatimonadales bacterium]